MKNRTKGSEYTTSTRFLMVSWYGSLILRYLKCSVVDRNRVDANPDTDWHQKDADPHADPTPSSTHTGKSECFNYFLSLHCQFTMFYLSHQSQMVQNFQYFAHKIEIFLKKFFYQLFHLFGTNNVPDRPDPDPQDC
jgi:hypothetical protein